MAADPLDFDALIDGLISHQKACGLFRLVMAHEPKAAPEESTAATFLNEWGAVPRLGGLASVSMRIEVITRLYNPMVALDEDAIDRRINRAVTLLWKTYAGDYTLGGTVMAIDLKGAYGPALRGKAGYVEIGGRLLRVVDLFTPLILADAFDEAA